MEICRNKNIFQLFCVCGGDSVFLLLLGTSMAHMRPMIPLKISETYDSYECIWWSSSLMIEKISCCPNKASSIHVYQSFQTTSFTLVCYFFPPFGTCRISTVVGFLFLRPLLTLTTCWIIFIRCTNIYRCDTSISSSYTSFMMLFHRLIIPICIGFSTRQCINAITFYPFCLLQTIKLCNIQMRFGGKKNFTENGNNFGSFIILWWVFFTLYIHIFNPVPLSIKQTHTHMLEYNIWYSMRHVSTYPLSFNLFRLIQCNSFQIYLIDNANDSP